VNGEEVSCGQITVSTLSDNGHWSIVICFLPKVAGTDQAPKTSAVTSFQISQVNWKMPWPRDAFISLPLSSALQ
jgi:hypothetical protein